MPLNFKKIPTILELYFGIQFGSIAFYCSFYCIECTIGAKNSKLKMKGCNWVEKLPFHEFNKRTHATSTNDKRFIHCLIVQSDVLGFLFVPCREVRKLHLNLKGEE